MLSLTASTVVMASLDSISWLPIVSAAIASLSSPAARVKSIINFFLVSVTTVVISHNLVINTLGDGRNLTAGKQKGTIDNMVSLKGPVFQPACGEGMGTQEKVESGGSASAAEEWHQESDPETSCQASVGGTLPDNDHNKNTSSEGKVQGDDKHSIAQGILAFKHSVLGNQEQNSRHNHNRGETNQEAMILAKPDHPHATPERHVCVWRVVVGKRSSGGIGG